jgi:hypothetical protein
VINLSIFEFRLLRYFACSLFLLPMTLLAQATPNAQLPEVPVRPDGTNGYYTGPLLPGVEVSAFIGAGEEQEASSGAPGLPNTHPVTPTGLVEAYLEIDNMDFSDVDYVGSTGIITVNGATVATAPDAYDATSAISVASVSPSAGTTYSFTTEVESCYFASVPTGTIPPPEPLPCDDNCGGDPPEGFAISAGSISPGPAFTGAPASSVTPGSCTPVYFKPISVTYGLPQITSISKQSANIGTSGSFTVTGSNLVDSDGTSFPSFSSTISVTVATPGQNSEGINFTIPSTQTMGNYQFTISNIWGTSNGVTFTVGGPPAAISSISPATWQAGSNFTLTVNGTGFGTAPVVTVSGAAGVTAGSATNSNPAGTQTQVNISVAANAPNGTALVSVQPGYTGSTYICGNCNGSSPVGTNTALIQAITPPSPTIILGTDVSQCGTAANQANANLTPSVGQRIAFIACIPSLPSGLTIATESWSPTLPNSASAIGNFAVAAAPTYTETISPLSATTCQIGAACAYSPFYFVTVGTSQRFTFTYTLQGSGQSGTAYVDVTSKGPSGVTIGVTAGTIQQYFSNSLASDVVGLGNGNSNATSGIFFSPSVSPSATVPGLYSWVQIVTEDQEGVVDPSAGRVVLPSDESIPGLDTSYPYSQSQSQVGDSPDLKLNPKEGEISQTFGATMFLMWTPQVDPNCISGTSALPCTVPVPLASVAWGLVDDTVNTLNPNLVGTYHNWLLNSCSSPTGGTTVTSLSKSTDYPIWHDVAD